MIIYETSREIVATPSKGLQILNLKGRDTRGVVLFI